MSTPAWLLKTFNQSCQISARTTLGTDEYNNPVYSNEYLGTSPCRLAPLSSVEIQGGRAGTSTYVLYLPAEAEPLVDSFTVFTIDGVEYEVDGPPQVYSLLFSTVHHHLEVNLIRSSA
jgi:hypothetical protein